MRDGLVGHRGARARHGGARPAARKRRHGARFRLSRPAARRAAMRTPGGAVRRRSGHVDAHTGDRAREGGVFATADAALAERVRRLSNYGFEAGIVTRVDATNAKLSEYAAAVGLAQLERSRNLGERRRMLWRTYVAALGATAGVRLQAGLHDAPALLGVALPSSAQAVAAALDARGIQTRRWYCPPLYHHPPFRDVQRIGPDGGPSLAATEHLASP